MTLGPEQIAMITIFDWIRWHKLDDVAFHIANERKCHPAQGAILKKMGTKPGVSDIAIMRAKNGFHGLFIEVKVGKGKPTPLQLEFLETMGREGYLACVRYGADEVIKTIENYLMMSSTYK